MEALWEESERENDTWVPVKENMEIAQVARGGLVDGWLHSCVFNPFGEFARPSNCGYPAEDDGERCRIVEHTWSDLKGCLVFFVLSEFAGPKRR